MLSRLSAFKKAEAHYFMETKMGQKTGHTLVLVHGIFNTGRIFSRMARYFEARGVRTLTPNLRPSSGVGGCESLGLQLKKDMDAEVEPEETLDLIGFSMGGLISRYYLQHLGGAQRVRRFVAISAPLHGSMLAWLVPSQGCRQMRPGSQFLAALNQDTESLAQVDMLTLWTPYDLMILPAKSSVTSLGRALKLPVLLHDMMIRDKRALESIAEFLLDGQAKDRF